MLHDIDVWENVWIAVIGEVWTPRCWPALITLKSSVQCGTKSNRHSHKGLTPHSVGQVVDKACALATYLYRNNASLIVSNMQRDLRNGDASSPPGPDWWKRVRGEGMFTFHEIDRKSQGSPGHAPPFILEAHHEFLPSSNLPC